MSFCEQDGRMVRWIHHFLLSNIKTLIMEYRTAVVVSLQAWMAESQEEKKNSSTPAYLGVLMSGELSSALKLLALRFKTLC